MNSIQWIFFDIGSTLVDEEEAYRHRVRDMVLGSQVTFEQFWEKREQFARAGCDGDKKAAAFFGLQKTPWHSEDEAPYPESADVLQELAARGYRLGVIANQNPGAKSRLDGWGLGAFFTVIASSSELGISKPDRRIFCRALEMAECRPENAVMVGDRLDNDIRPAKEIGMMTVRVRRGPSQYAEPSCEAEEPDYTIGDLRELIEIIDKFHIAE